LESGNKIREGDERETIRKSEGDRTKKGTGGRSRNWMEIKKVGHWMRKQNVGEKFKQGVIENCARTRRRCGPP
jgi:hypothetical protein